MYVRSDGSKRSAEADLADDDQDSFGGEAEILTSSCLLAYRRVAYRPLVLDVLL